jgi:hypothetical protein
MTSNPGSATNVFKQVQRALPLKNARLRRSHAVFIV